MILDRRSAWLIGVALVFSTVQWVVVAMWPNTTVAPLHYTIYFGIDLTGPSWQRYIIPSVATLIVFIHYLLGQIQNSVLWTRVWAITALTSILLLSAALATLRVVAFQ